MYQYNCFGTITDIAVLVQNLCGEQALEWKPWCGMMWCMHPWAISVESQGDLKGLKNTQCRHFTPNILGLILLYLHQFKAIGFPGVTPDSDRFKRLMNPVHCILQTC